MADSTCVRTNCTHGPTPSGKGRCPRHYWEDLKAGILRRDRGLRPEHCAVDGCPDPGWAKDWCKGHYRRWQHSGDPGAVLTELTWEQRFWAKVDRQSGDGCWLWLGGSTPGNYGVWTAGKAAIGETYVHRISYVLAGGTIPDGYHIDHLCHSRSDTCTMVSGCPHRRCVRPDHLEAVTPEENNHRAQGGTDTHCKYGHPYDGATQHGGRWRLCATCVALWSEQAKSAQSAVNPPKNKKLTHCRRGHEFTPENTMRNGSGRACRTCVKVRQENRRTGGRVYAPKTHCVRGHAMNGDNLRIGPDGARCCRACVRVRRAEVKGQAA